MSDYALRITMVLNFLRPRKFLDRMDAAFSAVKCILGLRLCRPGTFVVMPAFSYLVAALPLVGKMG